MRKSHGSIDRCTSEYIDGWFYCKDNKKIDIYADSVLVDTIYASKVREDVNSALNIQSVTGFTYFFNLSHTPVVVEIKFHNTDTHLNNSPIFVERNQLTNKTTTQRKRTTNSKKRILFLLSTYDGGTVHTTNDLIQGIKNKCECFILHAYKQELALYNNSKCLGKFFLNEKVLPLTHSSQEYDSIIKQIIIDYNIDVVHIRHICWHSLSFIEHIKELNVLIVFSFHDYYTICPSHNLLDEELVYCKGVCSSGCTGSKCNQVLWYDNQVPPLKHEFVFKWREMFSNFLKQCNVFITTHQSVADTLVNCYSFLQDKIKIIEHGRDLKVLKNKNILKDKITIIVPGTITYAKGLKEVQKLKELDVNNLFVIHYFSDVEYNIGIRHSLYNRENLSTLIKDIQPEIALVLSIWNETYCHVLTEMWNCNIPTICFNFETQKQRTLANEGGFVCENIIEVYNLLKTREFNCNMQLKNVSIKCMSKQYISVYC